MINFIKSLLNPHSFHIFNNPCQVGRVRIPILRVRFDVGFVVDVVPSDPVVSIERKAPPDRERPLHLPSLLEQLENAVSLRVVRQERLPLHPLVEHAGVLVPVVLYSAEHRVRDDDHFAVFVSC